MLYKKLVRSSQICKTYLPLLLFPLISCTLVEDIPTSFKVEQNASPLEFVNHNHSDLHITHTFYEESASKDDAPPKIEPDLLPYNQSALPQPILAEHPEWVDLYYKAWKIAYKNVKAPLKWNKNKESYLDEGFSGRIYQWDSAFMMHWAVYLQGAFIEISNPMSALDNFYFTQHENGAICREIFEETGDDAHLLSAPQFTNPPLFSWTEWEYYLKTGNKQRLQWVFPILDKYYDWYRLNRTRTTGHYWWDNLGSGMDNSPREPYSWIDYTSTAALDAYYLNKIATEIGNIPKAKFYSDSHEQIKTLVNESMWDDQNTMYWDLDKNNNFQENLTIASFWPLLAKIPSQKQKEGLVTYLESPDYFNTMHRIPSLPVNHPKYSSNGEYWQGSVWTPTNFMVIKGLEGNQFETLATELAENHIENISQLEQLSGSLWENYSPSSHQRGTPAASDFCGWTCLGPISLLIENIIGLRMNVPENELLWHLHLLEKHGLFNLNFGQAKINISVEKRTHNQEPIIIELESTQEFKLTIDSALGIFSLMVKPGKHQYHIKK